MPVMKSVAKVGLVIAALGVTYFIGQAVVDHLINKFSFKIYGYGLPKEIDVSNYRVKLPINISFHNPSPVGVTIDSVVADVFVNTGSKFEKIVRIDQSFALPPGDSVQTITPEIDLKKIFGNAKSSALSFLQKMKLEVRTEMVAVYKGYEIPKQTFENTISL